MASMGAMLITLMVLAVPVLGIGLVVWIVRSTKAARRED